MAARPAPDGQQRSVVTGRDAPTGALMAQKPVQHRTFAGRVAFSWASEPRAIDDRRPDRVHRPQRHADRPAALMLASLSNNVGAGLDPCGALQVP